MLQYALIFESVRMKMLFLFIGFLFIVLSPLSSFCIFLFSLCHSLSLPSLSSLLKISLIFAQDLLPPHLAVNLHSRHHWPLQPLPPTFRSLDWVVGVIFGMGFDVWVLCHWLIGWVGILGWWWCRGCGGGWLSFGPAMFVAIVGGGVCGWQCLLKILSFFFFLFSFLLRFLDFEFVGDLVIVIVVCGGWFAGGGDLPLPLPLVVCGGWLWL